MTDPGPRLLTDAELVTAKALLQPLFIPEVRTLLATHLDNTRRILDAFNALGPNQGGTINSASTVKVRYIVDLDGLTGGDIELGSFYWSNATIQSVTAVAKNYALSMNQSFKNLPYFQTKIWEERPNDIYSGFFTNGMITVPSQAVKDASVQVCTTSSLKNITIGRSSFDLLSGHQDFAVPRSSGGEPMLEIFRKLWRFCLLVRFPHDIVYLLNSGFSSASQIANTPRNTFVTTMTQFGMQAENAVAVQDYSLTVELRNEQVWTALLASKSNWTPASIASSAPTPTPRATPVYDVAPRQVVTYSNMFGDINVNVCEDCSSVTGPAAYFVDLLRMLKNAPVNPQAPSSGTLLDKLLARRPDLRQLQLSCANVNTLLPYIDLVNEVMESFVQNLASASATGAVMIQAYNVDGQDQSQNLIAQPQATNYNIYQQQIASQVFPPHVFPYSQAIDTMRSYFDALGSSRYEVKSVFGSKYRLNADASPSSPKTYKQAEKVLDYALASELLGLQPDDFVAITSNSIFPFDYYRLTGETTLSLAAYNSRIGLLGAAAYWGFSIKNNVPAENWMSGETNGIPLVTNELLPRAAISIQDLLDLLKTRFLGGRLALENNGNTPIFSGDVSDLRLRHPTDGSSMGMLSEDDCFALQAFLRLWRKSSLSMQDLDLVLSYFSDRGGVAAGNNPRIGSDAIAALAAVNQIISITGVSVEALMPFYGLMDTYGDNSLYVKLFLQGRANRNDPVFGKSGNGRYLNDDSRTISSSRNTLLAALGIPDEYWNAILAAGSISTDVLNLSNLSVIYRIFAFCNLLNISPFHYSAFISFFGKGFSPFKSPQATLEVLRSWRACVATGIEIGQVLHVTGKDVAFGAKNPGYGISIQQLVAFVSSILTGLINTEKSVPSADAITATTATASEVTRISSLMFEPVTAAQVKDFIEAPSPAQATVYQNMLLQYFKPNENEAHNTLFNQTRPTGTPEDIAVALEAQATDRRMLFLRSIVPKLRSRLISELILEVTKTLFPEFEISILRYLLSEVIRIGTPAKPAMDALSDSLVANKAALSATSFQGHFVPAATDSYRFCVPGPQGTDYPTVFLDGTAVSFEAGNQGWVSNEIRLVGGQGYFISRAKGTFANCTYSTRRAPPFPFTSDVLIHQQITSNSNDILLSTLRAVSFITMFKLSLSEIAYMQSLPSINLLAVDFGAISYENIRRIHQYILLRDGFESASLTIIDFMKWAGRQDREGNLAEKVSNVTGIPTPQVQNFLDANYPNLILDERVNYFRDVQEIQRLMDAWNLMSRLGVPGLTFTSLFKWATPIQPAATASEFDNSMELRALTRSLPKASDMLRKANNKLRDNQRRALIVYLLRQDYMRTRLVLDESNLFDFFLIDVQMGSCLQTSRIKQAISTVQLFIQRCILGLEKKQGVSSGTVNLDRWSWMQKYRLWEANRKVYLYPENWLDPTLRDDKSEAFRALEDSILQNDLNQSTLNDQIRTYLYAATEVSDLDVQAYLWDKVDSYSGTFHLFARTRHAPYSYYYRSLEISRDANPKVFWQPWAKIDAEITAIEADADGKALPVPGSYLVPALYGRRLILFLPQFTLKTISGTAPSATTKTFQQLGNENATANIPVRFWQVQMGWTEYRNGRWSPKKMSIASLSGAATQPSEPPSNGRVTPAAASAWADFQKFPSISQFKFSILSRPITVDGVPRSVLMIDMERWVGPWGELYFSYPHGRFELRDEKVLLGNANYPNYSQRPALTTTLPTYFGKHFFRTEWEAQIPGYTTAIRGRNDLPVLGIVRGIPGNKDIKWTLCMDETRNDRITGYVQDLTTDDTTTSYFTYPIWDRSAAMYRREVIDDYWLKSREIYSTDVLQNSLTPKLLEASTSYNNLDQIYKTLSEVPATATSAIFGKRNGPWHELSTPNALYGWELGVHVIMLVMERLQATQQFELALNVARYLFDPTIDGTNMDRCWRFSPFKDVATNRVDTAEDILKNLTPSSGAESAMQVGILEWRKNPFTAHAIARSRPSAYMKRIVMKYIEILIADGDQYFRQNTLETIPFAIQRYIEASQVFGATPRPVPNLAKSKPVSYADLETTLNDFSNAAFDMELDFPYYSNPAQRGGGGMTSSYPLTGILKSTYFCVPTNPKLLELGALINDRLFKIRNCQDINGVTRSLSLFEPPLDPGMIIRAVSRGMSLAALLNDSVGPMPNFRFVALLEKALDMCAELKNMGASFLAIRETKDAEGLAALQSRQESIMQKMTMDMKRLAITEIEKSITELQETRRGQETRLRFFLALTGDDGKGVPGENSAWDDIVQSIEKPTTDDLRLSSNEKLEMSKNASAFQLSSKAIALDSSAAIIRAIPDITMNAEPLGVGTTMGAVTVNISDALAMSAGVMRAVAQMDIDVGARAARKAELINQLQERRMEANVAGRDIKVTDKQIETMRVRLAICEEDVKQQRQLIAHAAETSEYLRNKYTSEQLYAWMESQIRTLFYQTFLLANDLAKKAQKVYRFERSADTVEYVEQSYWDSSRDGLLSGESLHLALKRMEAAYMEKRGHDFEITKNISIRQFQPLALLTLRETGVAEFSIPEMIFDFDFPGHYFRRIKTVNVTISSSTDLNLGVNTTLTLLEHRYRVKAVATTGQDYPLRASGDDDRFRTDQIPISSIATCKGNEDSGVFDYELEFNDYQRYVPFEGAGAISKWRLELPMPIKQFDYTTIDDVILQFKYTANGGGAAFRKAASDAAKIFHTSVTGLPSTDGLFAVLDLKSDFPTQWSTLRQTPASPRSVTLSGLQARLPFYAKGRTVKVESITAFVSSTTASTAWNTNLTLTGTSNVAWTNAPDVGSSKVVRATGLVERFTDWTVGLTAAGVTAGPLNILFVVRYYLN